MPKTIPEKQPKRGDILVQRRDFALRYHNSATGYGHQKLWIRHAAGSRGISSEGALVPGRRPFALRAKREAAFFRAVYSYVYSRYYL